MTQNKGVVGTMCDGVNILELSWPHLKWRDLSAHNRWVSFFVRKRAKIFTHPCVAVIREARFILFVKTGKGEHEDEYY